MELVEIHLLHPLSEPLESPCFSYGEYVNKPDGEHGHLYIYYDPPTETNPGAMLIGIERGSPNSKQHSISGKAGKVSAAGGSKLKDLGKKLAKTKKMEMKKKIR